MNSPWHVPLVVDWRSSLNQSCSATPAACIMPAALQDFVRAAGMRAGLSADAAATLAEPLVLADMMGVHTHGTKLLPG